MPPKAMKATRSKASKAMKAKKAMKAMKAKDQGMKAKQTHTKSWSETWTGLYYQWKLTGLKWEKGQVVETWDLTLRPGWKKQKAMKTMKATKAMKAKK
jgi:hypothetical protein